jgi:hypothetical protein
LQHAVSFWLNLRLWSYILRNGLAAEYAVKPSGFR